MTYLQIVKQMEVPEAVELAQETSLRNEFDERDESSTAIREADSSLSSNSFTTAMWRTDETVDASVATLRFWYGTGALDALPERISGFADELSRYSDRARLIGMVKAILDAAPRGSLTAQERAVQFVRVLTPLIEGQTR